MSLSGGPGDISLDGFGRVFVMQKADPLTQPASGKRLLDVALQAEH